MTKVTIVLEDTGKQVVLDAQGDISKGSFMEFLFLGLQDLLPIFTKEALKKYEKLQETQVKPTTH